MKFRFKINKKYIFYFSLIIISSCKINKPYTQEMKEKLEKMYNLDQEAQKYDLTKVYRKEYSDSIYVEFNKICRKNLQIVKQYYNTNGFPGIKENGEETAMYFWVIVQHGDDDVVFQSKILKAMKKELNKENASRRNYAFLYDRVMKNKNKPQLFGTQMIWDSTGYHRPYIIKRIKNVNRRRIKYDLDNLENYINKVNK